jgi:hypothetical protein
LPDKITDHVHYVGFIDCIIYCPQLDLSATDLPETSFTIGAPPGALINHNSVISLLNAGIPYAIFSNYHCHTSEYRYIAQLCELVQATTTPTQTLPPLTLNQMLLTLDLFYLFLRLRAPKDVTTRTAYMPKQRYSQIPCEEE